MNLLNREQLNDAVFSLARYLAHMNDFLDGRRKCCECDETVSVAYEGPCWTEDANGDDYEAYRTKFYCSCYTVESFTDKELLGRCAWPGNTRKCLDAAKALEVEQWRLSL